MTDDKIKNGGEMWDERFSSDEYAYGKEANIWLSERVSQIDPPPNNRALFPADGEGRNAVWAARIGWNSEVFDLSVVGKQKCHLPRGLGGWSVPAHAGRGESNCSRVPSYI